MNESPSTEPTAPLLLTVPQACEALQISRWQLYQLINDGRLKTLRINRRRFITPDDLHSLIEQLREGGEHAA